MRLEKCLAGYNSSISVHVEQICYWSLKEDKITGKISLSTVTEP